MSGNNFNINDEIPSLKNDTTVDIFKTSDFGPLTLAPDGEMRATFKYATYIIHNVVTMPKMFLPPTPAALPGVFTQLNIIGATTGNAILCDGDLTGHIWGRQVAAINTERLTFVDTSNSGNGQGTLLYDLVGGNGASSVIAGTIFAHINFKQVAKLVDMGIFQEGRSQEFNNNIGYVIRITPENAAQGASGNVSDRRFLITPGGTVQEGSVYTFIGDMSEIVFSACGVSFGKAANSFIHIDSASAVGNYNFTGCPYQGAELSGNFFRPDVSETITAMASANKSITAFTDLTNLSLTNAVFNAENVGKVGIILNVPSGHGLTADDVGAKIFNSGYTNGSYNGTFTLDEIIDDFDFRIGGTTFISDDAGSSEIRLTGVEVVQSKYTRGVVFRISAASIGGYDGVHTVFRMNANEDQIVIDEAHLGAATATLAATRITITTPHIMVIGETNTITGTTSYNGTTQILLTPNSSTEFDIPVTFVANDATGSVSSIGKTEKSIGVNCNGNGAQPNSVIIGAASSNAAATTTTPLDGTYSAINFGGLSENTNVSQRISLTTAANGIFTYNGTKPTTLKFSAPLNGFKGGANREYRFSPSINGAIPVFASADYAPWELQSVATNIYFAFFVDVEAGDTIQLMSAGQGTTDSFTITDTLLSLEEA